MTNAFGANGYPLLQWDRKPIDPHLLTGFALHWEEEFTLVHLMDDVHYCLDGYAVFRNANVRRWREVAPDEFEARAGKLQRLRPRVPAGLRLDSLKEIIATAGEVFPLLTLHRERLNRKVCYLGKFLQVNGRSVTLRDISPGAEWGGKERYALNDITLLEFGRAYNTLLARMTN